MNFSVFLFLVLRFMVASCEKCSQALEETFKKVFTVIDTCDDCFILHPGIFTLEENWAGFCTRNRFFLFKDRKCRNEYELMKTSEPIVMATNKFCEVVEEYDFDLECLKKLNGEICNRLTETKNLRKRDLKKSNYVDSVKFETESNFGMEKSTLVPLVRSRWSVTEISSTTMKTKSTEVTSTASTTEFTPTKATTTSEASQTTNTEATSTTSTTKFTPTQATTASEASQTTNTEATSTTSTTEFTPTKATTTSEASKTTNTEATSTSSTHSKTSNTEKTSPMCSTVATISTESTPATTKSTVITSTLGTEADPTSFKSTTSTPNFSIWSTTRLQHFTNKTCEKNEFFFNDHCYFIKFYSTDCNEKKHKLITDGLQIETNKNCQRQHAKALGLAVETEEENKFILDYLETSFYNKYIILTSGVRMYGQPDEWRGWNLKINQSVLKFDENDFDFNNAHYCIDPCKSRWYLFNPKITNHSTLNAFVICERRYNPKNVQLELHEACLELYRRSSCYDAEKHSNYCCEKDETGEIWFECPNITKIKNYPNNIECHWFCKKEGFFIQDRPTCKGSYFCNDSYNGIRYIAPVTRYAISKCPKNLSGYSTWYCNWNQTFLKTPDYSLCCEGSNVQCRNTDIFLNVWMGCPGKKVLKNTACPPNTILSEAIVEWYCQKNGTFNGTAPDYSNCNITKIECSKKDKYGTLWVAAAGMIEKKNCPPSFIGECFWKCQKSGKFDGPEPDCSRCRAAWMDEIGEKIKNHSHHEEVMNIMENYTKKEDLRIGYGHVLNLTADCVSLFKKQNPESKFDNLDKFLRSYSKILKNVAANPDLWSSFSESNRGEYADQILRITQSAAFANLNSKAASSQTYNVTFAKIQDDGFDFFVAYNPLLGSQFPLGNVSESSWKLDIKEINVSGAFAAMGLVMSYSLSSLMFPQGNKTEHLEMNSPAVTFTIAASEDGEVVDPNVVVSISFKHTNKTRLPPTEVITRMLHKGEKPSGVFNSTLCYYYRNLDWTTEGCRVTYSSKDQTNCTCSHLSTIGLLMSIHKYKPNKTLEFISIISSGITIISLIMTLLVLYFFDTIRNDRVLIGKNLCFCLLTGHFLLVTVMDKKFFNIPDNLCMVYAVLLHYVFMAAFAWMFVEGCHLYRMLVLVFDSNIEYRWIYLLIGYGVPFIIVLVTKILGFIYEEQPYGQDEMCWLKPPNFIWAFVGPVIISTSINFCILITAMKLAISAKRRTEKSSFVTLKLSIKGWISLSTLLGITWLFGLAYIHYNEMFVYTFVVFNGLQGFFIFIFRCVLCEQYKAIFLKKIKFWFSKSKSKNLKKGENLKSETKLYAISATKSFSGELEVKDSGYDPRHDVFENPIKIKTDMRKSFSSITTGNKAEEKSSGVDIDINFTLKPPLSEAYFRNRMIAKNFSVRKSKATWLAEADNISELSFDNIYHSN